MKTILAIAALASVIASPAPAQTVNRSANSQARDYVQQWQFGRAQAPRQSTSRSYDVFVNGQYVGSDPDPMVRQQLQREVESSD